MAPGCWNPQILTANSKSTQKITPRTGFSGLESKIQVQRWGLAQGFSLPEVTYRGGVQVAEFFNGKMGGHFTKF